MDGCYYEFMVGNKGGYESNSSHMKARVLKCDISFLCGVAQYLLGSRIGDILRIEIVVNKFTS